MEQALCRVVKVGLVSLVFVGWRSFPSKSLVVEGFGSLGLVSLFFLVGGVFLASLWFGFGSL